MKSTPSSSNARAIISPPDNNSTEKPSLQFENIKSVITSGFDNDRTGVTRHETHYHRASTGAARAKCQKSRKGPFWVPRRISEAGNLATQVMCLQSEWNYSR